MKEVEQKIIKIVGYCGNCWDGRIVDGDGYVIDRCPCTKKHEDLIKLFQSELEEKIKEEREGIYKRVFNTETACCGYEIVRDYISGGFCCENCGAVIKVVKKDIFITEELSKLLKEKK